MRLNGLFGKGEEGDSLSADAILLVFRVVITLAKRCQDFENISYTCASIQVHVSWGGDHTA